MVAQIQIIIPDPNGEWCVALLGRDDDYPVEDPKIEERRYATFVEEQDRLELAAKYGFVDDDYDGDWWDDYDDDL